MAERKIIGFIDKLTENTKSGYSAWENDERGYSRLVLNTGSVIFEYSFDEMVRNYHYTIKLYDTTEQFASFYVDYEDNFDEELFSALDRLRLAINERKDEIINAKIQQLFDDLK